MCSIGRYELHLLPTGASRLDSSGSCPGPAECERIGSQLGGLESWLVAQTVTEGIDQRKIERGKRNVL